MADAAGCGTTSYRASAGGFGIYTRSELGGTQTGRYAADVAWTVTFRRVSRIRA